ncbi:MAG: hypothetical protein K2O87_07645, partial [Duncaniella freteri]|nr:hypothetical protein [Duncaniella freteri]
MDTDPLPAIEAALNFIPGIIDLPLLAIPAMGAGQIAALALAVVALFISGFVSGSEIAFFSLSPTQCD